MAFGIKKLRRRLFPKRPDFDGDGVRLFDKNPLFLGDPAFNEAYSWSMNFEHQGKTNPFKRVDLRWRAHVCVWAAAQGLMSEGAFVECGVSTAILSGVIARYFKFENFNRPFFLFDTYEGIPVVAGMTSAELDNSKKMNHSFYSDSYQYVKEKMKQYDSIRLVKGQLPGSLDAIMDQRISYLSMDLNNAPSEIGSIRRLWPLLVPGAIVVLDDYAFKGCEEQQTAWDGFATDHGRKVVTLPTGQGLLIK